MTLTVGSGALTAQLTTGDLKLTSTVHARRASAPSQPPAPSEQLGGVMARAPSAPRHRVAADDDVHAILRRVGATFQLLRRAPGATSWTLAATFMRPDLPPTLQAGLKLYSAASPFDLQATYDEATFASVAGAADCSTD